MGETNSFIGTDTSGISRRRFFGYAGALAGAGLLAGMAGCRDEDYVSPVNPGIDLGSGDTGILNYAYVLEQLEAAFYERVTGAFYAGATDREKSLLADIRDHEMVHRELFKAMLGSKAIPALTFNFSGTDFNSRSAVLSMARTFEDLGVSAYNGAGILISDPAILTLAGKIVSVEARHSAVIREMLQQSSFADTSVLNPVSRIDQANTPKTVLAIATQYINEKLNADNLPSV
jgi:rubrerythrin